MSKAVCLGVALCLALPPPAAGGFIKDLVAGAIGGATAPNRPQPGHPEDSHHHGHRPYKNTSWHIDNEDYLTPNGNESSDHRQRPTSGYGGGGTYDKKPSTPTPYRNTSSHIDSEDYLSPNRRQGGSRPSTAQQHKRTASGEDSSLPQEHGSVRDDQDDRYSPALPPRATTQPQGSPTPQQATETSTGDAVFLSSDSVFCCYSNIRSERIEDRRMTCNHTECRLERTSEKSSFWICGDIKCNVANVDFSQTGDERKLMECAMDGRNLIRVQDKPIKCAPNEKPHNGRCRRVFGA